MANVPTQVLVLDVVVVTKIHKVVRGIIQERLQLRVFLVLKIEVSKPLFGEK